MKSLLRIILEKKYNQEIQEETIDTKELYIGKIKYKTYNEEEYNITKEFYVFKKGTDNCYIDVINDECYFQDDDFIVVNLISFKKIFPNLSNVTKDKLKELIDGLTDEEIEKDNNKERKLIK